MKKQIIICGIPGMGKTTIGRNLEKLKGYYHLDVEEHINTNHTFPDLNNLPNKTVLTFGFDPTNPPSLRFISELIGNGCKMIWLDGNRQAARNAFIKRGDVPIELFKDYHINAYVVNFSAPIY